MAKMACKIESSAATLHLETALEETHKPTHSIIGSAHLFQGTLSSLSLSS